MFKSHQLSATVAAFVVTSAAILHANIIVETVTVANPGNPPDFPFGSPFGEVDYIYNMGKYEVSAGQYTAFLNAVARTDTYELYNGKMGNPSLYNGCNIIRNGVSGNFTYSVAGDWADRPVNYVNWGDAARFMNWLSNDQPTGAQGPGTTEDGSYLLNGAMGNIALLAVTRKPTATWVFPADNEWYKAAYHKNDGITANYWKYPTQSNTPPSNSLSNPNPDYGNNANLYDSGYTIGAPYFRTIAGEFENSESSYNTFDQGGNIHEWTELIYFGLDRGSRGGSFYNPANITMSGPSNGNEPITEYDSLGFRVARLPEPATLTILLVTSIGIFSRKRNVAITV